MIIFNYKFHLLFATLVFIAINLRLYHILTVTSVIGCAFTFMLPDIDQRFKKLIGHRKFTHSLIALLIIAFIGFSSGDKFLMYGMLIGYGSHLIADMSTPMGIPLLWPFKFRFRIPILSKYKWLTATLWLLILLYLIGYDKNLWNTIQSKNIF